MNKKEFVHNLKNVKLVIGNGFDLFCGLKTSYADYFNSRKAKNKNLIGWHETFKNNVVSYTDFGVSNSECFWVEPQNLALINIWDVFFFLLSYDDKKEIENWKWCDVESKMLEYLGKDDKEQNTNNILKKYINLLVRIFLQNLWMILFVLWLQ